MSHLAQAIHRAIRKLPVLEDDAGTPYELHVTSQGDQATVSLIHRTDEGTATWDDCYLFTFEQVGLNTTHVTATLTTWNPRTELGVFFDQLVRELRLYYDLVEIGPEPKALEIKAKAPYQPKPESLLKVLKAHKYKQANPQVSVEDACNLYGVSRSTYDRCKRQGLLKDEKP